MSVIRKHKSLFAQIALLLAGLIWGSGFAVMKNTLDAIPVSFLLAIRFSIAAVVLCLFLIPRLRRIRLRDVGAGALAGVCLFLAYFTQTHGLHYTTAGKNAFLTTVYVILVPFLWWWIRKERPTKYNAIAAVLCLIGVGVLSLTNDFTINKGDALTLLCGVMYAIHIIVVSVTANGDRDLTMFVMLQFAFAALCGWLVGAATETFPTDVSFESAASLLYLGLVCTLLALLFQNIGLKYAPASHASLLMSTEAPFGCIFGILLLGEPFTYRTAIGCVLILCAIVLSELKGRKAAS